MGRRATPHLIDAVRARWQHLRPRRAGMYQWLTIGMLLLVGATVTAVALPAVAVIWWQLDLQVRARVTGAQTATQALIRSERSELRQFVRLVSGRPTLCGLIAASETSRISPYLERIRADSGVDLLLVFLANGSMSVAGADGSPIPANIALSPGASDDVVVLGEPPVVAIYASEAAEASTGCPGADHAQVAAVKLLDSAYLHDLASETGIQQSLIVDGWRVASSFPALAPGPLSVEAAARVEQTGEACCTTGGTPENRFYVGLAPLTDASGSVVALSEVALPAEPIQRILWIALAAVAATSILVAGAGAAVSLRLTRSITRPLQALSESTERMRIGDLETPFPLRSGWFVIDRLAGELEHARRELREQQLASRRELSRVAHLLGAIREGVLTVSGEGRLTWINPDACTMLSRERVTVLGKPIGEVLPPAPGENLTIEQILQPCPGQALPGRLTVLDGGGKPVVLSILVSGPSRGRTESVIVLRNVTEEQASSLVRSEFLANVAHEFRTPLSAMSASAELLADESQEMSSHERADLSRSIRLSALHLQALVDNLLESASIQAGVFHLRRRYVKLADVLAEAMEMICPLILRRGQRLATDFRLGGAPVLADPDRLKEAVLNLLHNASKFGPSRSAIELCVNEEAESIKFSVSDSGPGLPADRFGELFNRFVTSGRSGGALYGIGLGLPIVKVVAEAYGGTVGAQNRPGGGATVWFTILTDRTEA